MADDETPDDITPDESTDETAENGDELDGTDEVTEENPDPTFAPVDRAHIVAQASGYLLDWCLGWLVLGPVSCVLLGLLAVPTWAWWSARARRRGLTEGTPPRPLPRSSESPP